MPACMNHNHNQALLGKSACPCIHDLHPKSQLCFVPYKNLGSYRRFRIWSRWERRGGGGFLGKALFTVWPDLCRWEDIAGLEGAITLIKEAVVQPIKYPQFFTGLLAPWKVQCQQW